jgi:hypothetical protein
MIDRSRQLVIRVDLYFGYIFVAAILISACEIPLLAIRTEAARYVLPVGWLALLSFAAARMWQTKITHGLTSELQVYKIVLGCILIWVFSGVAYMAIANLGSAKLTRLGHFVELAFILNAAMAFDVMAICVLGIWLFDRLHALARGTSL